MSDGISQSVSLPKPSKKNDFFLLVLLAGSLALNVYLGWSVKRLGAAAAGVPPAPVKLSAGAAVGPVTATDLGGKQETIGYVDSDKPTVFYVFSPACVWCERNAQNINAVAARGESFRFVGLSLSDEGLTEYVQSHHLSFPVYKAVSEESVKMLGLGSTPQTIVISPDGHVLKNWSGAYTVSVQPEVEEFFKVRLPGLAAQKQ
jgi:peroxiredoxin